MVKNCNECGDYIYPVILKVIPQYGEHHPSPRVERALSRTQRKGWICENGHLYVETFLGGVIDDYIRGENYREGLQVEKPRQVSSKPIRARKVTFQECVNAGLLKDRQTLYLYDKQRIFKDEQAQIIASSNELLYLKDGHVYSKSRLATKLLDDKGYSRSGPRHWITEDGQLLEDIENRVRKFHGDRRL